MNPALMKALKARRSKPASGSPGTPKDAVGVVQGKGHAHHFKEMKRHLEEGSKGSRATAKVKLRLALHHANQMDQPTDPPNDQPLEAP